MGFTLDWKLMRSFSAEFLVTVFFGVVVYGVITNTTQLPSGQSSPAIAGVAIGFGAVALIYSFCDITIAHFNPAMTLGAMVSMKIPVIKGLIYMLMQFLGAIVAGCCAWIFYRNLDDQLMFNLVSKRFPGTNVFHAMSLEFFTTLILVYVACATAINAKDPPTLVRVESGDDDVNANTSVNSLESGTLSNGSRMRVFTTLGGSRAGFAPIAIGLTLGMLGMINGASSAGYYNPALTLAPSLLAMSFRQFYIYFPTELLGGLVAGLVHHWIFEKSDDED